MDKKVKRRIIKTFGLGTYKGIYLGYLKIVPYSESGGIETVYTKKSLGDKFGRTWFHAHQYNPFLFIEDYI
jgi:hypothetical protein